MRRATPRRRRSYRARLVSTDPAPKRERGVVVVTDSTSYLPRLLVAQWAVRQVSLYVGWDGDPEPEHEDRDLAAFYRRLQDSPKTPVTSQPAVGDFLACLEPVVSAGRD